MGKIANALQKNIEDRFKNDPRISGDIVTSNQTNYHSVDAHCVPFNSVAVPMQNIQNIYGSFNAQHRTVGRYNTCDKFGVPDINYEDITVDFRVNKDEIVNISRHKPFVIVKQVAIESLHAYIVCELQIICNQLENNIGNIYCSAKCLSRDFHFRIKFNVEFDDLNVSPILNVIYAEPVLIGGYLFVEIHCVLT